MDVFEKVEGVAKIIGVAASTVKKYYLLFEQEGYKFKRSQDGHVLFSTHDVDLFKKLIILKNQPGMTVSKAVKEIVKSEVMTVTSDTTDITLDITDITNVMTVMSDQVATVMTEMSQLKQMIKEQNEIIKNQQKYIDERLEQRDRKLIESLRESQEERKTLLQLAAAQEEGKKKGFFARLFSK
jgi:hypothetical protein